MSWREGHGVENVPGGSARRGSGGVNTSNKRDVERGGPGHGRGLGHQRGLRGGALFERMILSREYGWVCSWFQPSKIE